MLTSTHKLAILCLQTKYIQTSALSRLAELIGVGRAVVTQSGVDAQQSLRVGEFRLFFIATRSLGTGAVDQAEPL